MTYPSRLLDSLDDEFAVQVLRSADLDEPSASALADTAAAVGISLGLVGALASVSAASGATAAAAAAAPQAAAVGATKLGALFVAKYIAIGLMGGLVTTGAVHQVSSVVNEPPASEASPPPAATAPAPAPQQARPVSRSAASEQEDDAVAREDSPPPTGDLSGIEPPGEIEKREAADEQGEPPVAAFETLGTASDSAKPQGPGKRISLADEVVLLDQARRALRQRNAGEAMRQLDQYSSSAPSGALATEATVLRVEALLQQGRHEQAAQLAREVVARDPHGRHAARLRSLAAQAGGSR